jgi:subtilisin family serine protease
VDASEIEGRPKAIAARFNGQVKHVYVLFLNGFSIRVSEQELSNMIRTSGLGIVRAYRSRPVSAYASKEGKGLPTSTTVGDGSTRPETLGRDIGRVTGLTQDANTCAISGGSDFAALTTGPNPLKVCVIDTVVSTHPDLHVIEGTSDLNFSSDRGATEDLNGHGSHVAGTIGATANNGIGVVGVAPGAYTTPIKVLNRRGSGSMEGVIAGVNKAVEIGCDIANMSLGASDPYNDYPLLDDAVMAAANTGGVIFTLAAGNSFEDIASHTPARATTSDSDNIFTIASSWKDKKGKDLWSDFSNFDLTPLADGMVDFALLGNSIKSTWKNDGYDTISGTSVAAPHMAGLLVRLGTVAKGNVSNGAFGTAGGSVVRGPYPSGVATEPAYRVASDGTPAAP